MELYVIELGLWEYNNSAPPPMSSKDKLFMLKSQPTVNQAKARPTHTKTLHRRLSTSLPKLRLAAPIKAMEDRRMSHVIDTEIYTDTIPKYSIKTSTESIRSTSSGAKQWQKKTICISCIYLSRV